jgi:integrase/recombinase XerD
MKDETINKVYEENDTKESSVKKRKAKKLPVAISYEEFLELLKYTKKKHHKLSFLLGFESGLRISEVLKLETRDIDLKEKKIFIRQGKGSKDRVVGLPKHFKEDYLKLLPIKCGERALEKAFKRSAENAKLLEKKPELHFHSLRHGFGSHLANKGVPIHHIRTLMGHTNISTTNVYLELNPTQALKSVEELF